MDTLALGLKYFFVDLVGGILRWPIWWYTQGLADRVKWAGGAVSQYARMLALGVWMKNIFVPMYGARDWQSRLISIFMRTVQIVGRSIALLVWALMVLVMFIVYIALPPVSAFFLFYHVAGLFS